MIPIRWRTCAVLLFMVPSSQTCRWGSLLGQCEKELEWHQDHATASSSSRNPSPLETQPVISWLSPFALVSQNESQVNVTCKEENPATARKFSLPSIFGSPKPPMLTNPSISLNEGIQTHPQPQSEIFSVHASRGKKTHQSHLDGVCAAGPTLERCCGLSVIRAPRSVSGWGDPAPDRRPGRGLLGTRLFRHPLPGGGAVPIRVV